MASEFNSDLKLALEKMNSQRSDGVNNSKSPSIDDRIMREPKYNNPSPSADLKQMDEEIQTNRKKGRHNEAIIGSFNPDYNYDKMMPKRGEKGGYFKKGRDSVGRSRTHLGHYSSVNNSMNKIDLVNTFMKD